MMTPIEVTRSKLPGDMAHMMPAQNTDPKEYQQVQRRKEDNVPRDLIGNTIWSAEETGGTWICYLERRQKPETSHGTHQIHQNRGCMVWTPLCKKHPICHHGFQNSQREIRTQEERGENPKPIPMEERP